MSFFQSLLGGPKNPLTRVDPQAAQAEAALKQLEAEGPRSLPPQSISALTASPEQQAEASKTTSTRVAEIFNKIYGSTTYLKQVITTRFGIKNPLAANQIAEASFKATEARKTAMTWQFMNQLAVGSAATLAVAGVASGPLAPAILGLSVLLQVVLNQHGLNRELLANLAAIQLEVDSMFMVVSVVEKIIAENRTEENKLQLNSGRVRLWIGKVTDFVALVAGPEAMDLITKARGTLVDTLDTTMIPSYLKTSDKYIKNQQSTFDSWRSFFNRTLAPTEYLRILVREVIILDIFFGIMMADFDILMRAHGDSSKKAWVTSDEFRVFSNANDNTIAAAKKAALKAQGPAVTAAIAASEQRLEAVTTSPEIASAKEEADTLAESTIMEEAKNNGVTITAKDAEDLTIDAQRGGRRKTRRYKKVKKIRRKTRR